MRGPPLDVGPVRRQAVPAALALRPGTLVSHEQLLDDVWGAQPPGSGRRVLPSYVYPLRKAPDAEGAGPAGSLIRSGRGGYPIDGSPWRFGDRRCLGITDIHQGRYRTARAWFSEALHLSRHRADRHEEARARCGLGAAELNLGRGEQAIPSVTTAIEQAQRLDAHWLAALGLGLVGMVHHLRGRYDQAPACYTPALAHAETNGRPRLISKALTCIADVHLALGRYGRAKTLYCHAADLAQRVGDVLLHAIILTRLGTAEHGAGNLSVAADLHHEALSRHRTLCPLTEPHRDRLEMDIRYRLGRTYSAAGRVAEAREQFHTALALPGADEHPEERAQALAGLEECTDCRTGAAERSS
ncbi:tetratricopeptide repeat protein [Streptomyces sp. NPDC048650]|uniref:tetratricopeptide repeat protein n=1 Tax=unclassified Streptomyces TaxID=2593676 RepID=UPI003710591C